MASTADPGRVDLLALTQGDPSGIGPEITLKAWLRLRRSGRPFVAIGDPAIYRTLAHGLDLAVPVSAASFDTAAMIFPEALPVVPTEHTVVGTPGRPTTADASGTLSSIRAAVSAVREGSVAGVVTNPIAKGVLYRAGFAHPGHTEYLAELAEALWGHSGRAVMMLWSRELAVVPVTIHVPLAEVPRLLTADLIVETALIVERALRDRFGIAEPRLALAGLNPHAGEDGAMGREEIETIGPAAARLRERGLRIEGPLPADTMFHPEARRRYDVALAMYHDQGLVPIKTLSFDTGVNVTLGLPFVRTSPDHGTAFGIAGTGTAKPDSLIAALDLAARLTGAHAVDRAA